MSPEKAQPTSRPIEPTNHSEQETMVSWQEFQSAFGVFANDYSIVGHDGEPVISIFDGVREAGKYTVTGLSDMTEAEFQEKVAGKSFVVLIQCMDARGANQTYQAITQEQVVGSEHQRGTQSEIMLLSMGGGIIQVPEILHNGEPIQVSRDQAIKTILQYLAQHIDLAKLVATDHDCRCGACAYYNDGVGVPEVLDVERGSEAEQAEMIKRIVDSIHTLVPLKWLQDGLVEARLAHFDGEEGKEKFASFVKIPLEVQ